MSDEAARRARRAGSRNGRSWHRCRAVLQVQTRRLPHAYPLYTKGYREAFDALDRWIGGMDGLVTFGRQGLFAHDNTHHTMAMAYALVDSLRSDGTLDRDALGAGSPLI